jgi:hypothetical protein
MLWGQQLSRIKRNLVVQIDDIAVRDPAKITARITKDVESDSPDFCEVTIYNLTEATRSKIIASKRIEVSGGYSDTEEVIFTGDIQAVLNKKDPSNWKTTIIAGDGATAMVQSIINKTYKKPTDVKTVLEDIARTSGLAKKIEFIDIENSTDTLRGTTRVGRATSEINNICLPRDWTWNIQNDTLVICKHGKGREIEAYKISVDTGMIGSPEWVNTGQDLSGKEKKDGQKIKVDSLCIPSIKPNDKVRIQTMSLSGRMGTFVYKRDNEDPMDDVFIVQNVTHDLDSREGSFKSSLECLKEGT